VKSAGIDPGLSGALALLDSDGLLLEIENMPTLTVTKTRRQLDAAEIVGLFEDWRAMNGEFRVTLERQGIMPGQGASSGLKLGIGYGTLLGILAAQKIPHEIVTPQAWQKALFGKIEKGTSKDRARAFAQQQFPGADLGKRKTQDRSDALCIALYGLRQWRVDP